jgi:hypothetical protein
MPQVAGAVRGRQRTQALTISNLFGDEEVLVCLARRTCA